MNRTQNELTVEYKRQRIHEEFKRIQFVQPAIKSRVYHPGRFDRLMFYFASWMISTGKLLRDRYEIPVANSSDSPFEGSVH